MKDPSAPLKLTVAVNPLMPVSTSVTDTPEKGFAVCASVIALVVAPPIVGAVAVAVATTLVPLSVTVGASPSFTASVKPVVTLDPGAT